MLHGANEKQVLFPISTLTTTLSTLFYINKTSKSPIGLPSNAAFRTFLESVEEVPVNAIRLLRQQVSEHILKRRQKITCFPRNLSPLPKLGDRLRLARLNLFQAHLLVKVQLVPLSYPSELLCGKIER